VTYESSSIVGFHSTDAPVSAEAALNPANYQISPSAGMLTEESRELQFSVLVH